MNYKESEVERLVRQFMLRGSNSRLTDAATAIMNEYYESNAIGLVNMVANNAYNPSPGERAAAIETIGRLRIRPCPNCAGTDIDLSFKPPRCRFCDPIPADNPFWSELEKTRRRLDFVEGILGRIAQITSDQGALFLNEHGHDDWDAAIDWLQKHISLTPEQSMLEQHRECVNGWRDYVDDERNKKRLFEDACYHAQHKIAQTLAGEYPKGGALRSALQVLTEALNNWDENIVGVGKKSARQLLKEGE